MEDSENSNQNEKFPKILNQNQEEKNGHLEDRYKYEWGKLQFLLKQEKLLYYRGMTSFKMRAYLYSIRNKRI